MTYTPYYPGGWKDYPLTATPIIAAALQNIENGVIAASIPPIDWINVAEAPYNADPTGSSDSTAAIQAAIAAATYISANDSSGILGAAQATIYFPGGTYLINSGPLVLTHGHSFRLTGAGDGTTLKSSANAIIDFDGLNGLTEGSIEIDHLGFDCTGGHVFQNANLHGVLSLHDLAIRQRSTGYSVFWMDDVATGHSTGLYEGVFRNIRYTLDPGTRSIEAWHILNSHGDGVTDLTWEHVSGPVPTGYTGNDSTMDNTQYQWLVTNTGSSGAHVTNITWRNCIMSSPFGGIIKVGGAQGVLIENVSAYNTYDRAITNSLYYLHADPTGGAPVEGAVIRNCTRTTALGNGSTQPPYDILLDSTCKNVLIENTIMGYSPGVAYIDVAGAAGVVVIQPGGGGAGGVPVISNQAADTVVIGQGQITIGGVAIGSPSYDTYVAGLTPAAWWKLADGSGSSTAADSSGNGWTGTATSVTFGNAGPINSFSADTSGSFNGSSSKISSSFNPSGISNFSVVLWINNNTSGNMLTALGHLFGNDNPSSTNNGWALQLTSISSVDGYPVMYVGNGTTNANARATTAVPSTGWTCIIATVNTSGAGAQAIQMYINGVNQSHSGTLTGTLTAGANGTYIGCQPTGSSFTGGLFAQAAFIEATLTAAQAQAIYNAGIAALVNSVTAKNASMVITGTAAAPILNVPGATNWFNVVYGYGADPTGVADSTTAISNAISALPSTGGVIYFPAGTYKVSSALTCTKVPTLFLGDGRYFTVINYTGSGDCIRYYSTQQYTSGWGGGIKGLTIDGTSASAGACGAHLGDIYQLELDFCARKFQGTGSKGVWFDNQYYWTEDMYGHVFAEQNTANVVFDNSANVSGSATNSFARALLNIVLDCKGVGSGVILQGGAEIYDGKIGIFGNIDYGTSQFYALSLTGQAGYSFTATNASPCVFTATGSYYSNGTAVTLSGGSLPAGFTAGTTYYVVAASGATFELAATSGGAAINSTSTGSGTVQGPYSHISNSQLNIGMECNGTSGTQPITINFASAGNNVISQCTGIIDFSVGNAFAGASNFAGSITFDGPIYGDANLMRVQGLGQNAYFNGAISNGATLQAISSLSIAHPSSNVTGVILQDGGNNNQLITVVNYGTGSITFAALATSHVVGGTSITIAAGTTLILEWLSQQSAWYPIAAGGGGGGGVASVTAGDSSIVIGGTGTNPTVASVPGQLVQRIFNV